MPTYWLTDTQKFGIAFCAGGVFFMSAGVVLFFDRAMLAMGNILILLGTALLLGPQSLLAFALRPTKRRGSAAFAVGATLILLRWTLIGFAIEAYGAAILLGDALGLGAAWARQVPGVGPYLAQAMTAVQRLLGRAGGGGSEPPV